MAADDLRREFDAVCLAIGASRPRDLDGARARSARDSLRDGFPHAAEPARWRASHRSRREAISARGKRVIIIGGGDTGSDCAGTCLRQGAKSVRQFELLPQPPESRSPSTPWPLWPMQLRTIARARRRMSSATGASRRRRSPG